MVTHPPRIARPLAGAALLAIALALPAGVAATTNGPIAQTGGMTTTLPLLGTSMTVAVSLDASGNISGVTLTPSGTLTATSTTPEVVRFSSADGTTKVSVRAKGSKLSLSAHTGSLSDLVGAATWAADVFGTGAKSSVGYTVGTDGSGGPTITIGAVSTPSDVTSQVMTLGSKGFEGSDEGGQAVAGVSFARQGFKKDLTIKVDVDRDGTASLKITLSGRDRQKLTGTLAALAGARTWAAHLCDGTAVAVAYHVAGDGTIAYDGATGAPATERARYNGIAVRFDGTAVGVRIGLRSNGDGTYTLVVLGSSGMCGHKGWEHTMAGGMDGFGGWSGPGLPSFGSDSGWSH